MKKKNLYIIQDHQWIIDLFGSRNPLQVLIYLVPILIYLLIKILSEKQFQLLIFMTAFILGLVVWSFLEYFIHRYIYHSKLSKKLFNYTIGSFHLYHHQNMFDLRVLNAGFLMIYSAAFILLAPILFLFQNWFLTASFGLGLLLGYYFYEWVHYLIHYKKFENGYMNYIQKYHFHHHDHAPHKNYGNTNHFWDVVFNTFDKRYKNYNMPENTQKSLIISQQKKENGMIHV